MGLFDQFPYTNFHELNLDWILRALKELEKTIEQFVSINSLKYADPIQWDITSQYEKNTIVIDPQTGTAYISIQPVPAGVALTETDYWTVVFNLKNFVVRAAKNFTTRYENDTTLTATFSSAAGEWLVWGDVLYVALVNITAGDSYVVGSNIRHITMEEVINDIKALITAEATARQNAIAVEATARQNADTALQNAITAEATARQNADTTLQNAITAEATARAQADNAINEAISKLTNVQDWSHEYVLFLGDSYLTRENSQNKTIVDLICDRLGITNYTNAATGGASFAGGQIATQITNADASIPYTQCIILAGINDARFSNVISTSPIPNYNILKAALGSALSSLKTKYPQFKNIYLGYIGSRTIDATDGQGDFESIAASTYAYIYDGMRIGYIYLNGVENIMHRNLENYASDGLHPSNQGIADIANGVANTLITGNVETKLPLHDLLMSSTSVNNASAGTGNNFRVVMSNDHFNLTVREAGVTNLTTAHSATQGTDLQLYSNLYDKFETDIYIPIFVDVLDNGTTTHEKALLHLNNRDMFIRFLDASHSAITKITTHFATADYPYTYIN